jgi:Family of unknown function (DUF6496)
MPSKTVMNRFERGKLRSGNRKTGPVVTNPMQAVAIKYSEERAEKAGRGHGKRKKGRRSAKRR